MLIGEIKDEREKDMKRGVDFSGFEN